MDKKLEAKIAYFKEQDLLDISDDETGFPDQGLRDAERLLAEHRPLPPPVPSLVRQRSSFLGPTPKERMAEFKRQTAKERAGARAEAHLVRTETAPDPIITSSFPAADLGTSNRKAKLKRNVSLSDLPASTSVDLPKVIPFWKQVGDVPREVKSAKSAKLADDIKLEPEQRQLFKGKIIYFYPNNDTNMARRTRIHKMIQLGAAWVKKWRNDVTHIMTDDLSHPVTYSHLLQHLAVGGTRSLSSKVVLVKYEPYVPHCILANRLLDPTLVCFRVKGAPPPGCPAVSSKATTPSISQSSQTSLEIKPSKRQLAVQGSQKTDSLSVADSFPPPVPSAPTNEDTDDERVEDSFMSPIVKPKLPTVPPAPANGDTDDERVEDSFMSPGLKPKLPPKTTNESAKPITAYNDALSEAIEQMKAVQHLPLDDDEEEGLDSSRPSTSAGDQDSGNDTEEEVVKIPKTRRAAKWAALKKNIPGAAAYSTTKGINLGAFQCMDPRASNATATGNPNARTIEILDGMGRYYDQMQDQWRTLAYRKAIGVLRKQTTKICTKEQAEALPCIGSRLAEKIEEIVLTNRLRRLDSTRDDPTDQVLRLFLGIYGVGLSQAHKWIQMGYRTLDDLVQKAKLTQNQKIGIEHYDDFATRIPRKEVETHGAYVRNALKKLDPDFEVKIMGSYRRGAQDSGDIDLLITKPGTSIPEMRDVIFGQLVPQLTASKFLKASLATSHRHDDGTKWHGVSCLKSSKVWRRLDLLLVPEEQMGAALIYFTGNDIFNRSIRLLASKKGMRLNQKGLYKDVVRGRNREKLNEGTLVEGRDEKKIFEILGVPWRPPTERIC